MNAAAAAAAVVAVLTLTITTTTVLAAAPAPAPAPGKADEDLTTPMKLRLFPYDHVHISNELGPNKAMTVHCTSRKLFGKKVDLGIHHVAAGDEYWWQFRPRFLFGKTKYWCVVSPVDDDVAEGPVHVGFYAYIQDDASIAETDYNVYWAVKSDGVYMRDKSRQVSDLLSYVWMPGK